MWQKLGKKTKVFVLELMNDDDDFKAVLFVFVIF